LYLNGTPVSRGPAKGDIRHHFYETINLDLLLRPGKNVLAAKVVSYASSWPSYSPGGAPNSIMTATNAFVLDGRLLCEDVGSDLWIGTDVSWKVIIDRACRQVISPPVDTITGMGEDFDAREYPQGWQEVEFDDRGWEAAVELDDAATFETVRDTSLPYLLTPRIIPQMRETPGRFASAYQVTGATKTNVLALLAGAAPLIVGPNAKWSFVLDVGELTTAFPLLDVSGGNGASVKMTYAEAWTVEGVKSPHHRPEDGSVVGVYDRYTCGVGEQAYEPFHWRTFRYVLIEIDGGREGVTLTGLSFRVVGYPYSHRAEFASSNPEHQKMMEVSLRTLQLCSHETFEDCPYYEQLQYSGDFHATMLFAGYAFGDWQLARQGLIQFDWSRGNEGLTQSRYPSRVPQYIPPFSLIWILAVRDYWRHTGDDQTVRSLLPGIHSVLNWFALYQNDEGLLAKLPYWKIVDWAEEWTLGCPPGAMGGVSAVINLQYVTALVAAAELGDLFNRKDEAAAQRDAASRIKTFVNQHCWREEEGLYVDQPGGDEVSELGNAWAIISGVAAPDRAQLVGTNLKASTRLTKATLYGRFYVFRALSQAGMYQHAETFFDWWTLMLDSDLTTWPEEPWLARSFCHAWSSTPLYEFLAEVLGVKPAAPGFKDVLIAPQISGLSWARGLVPTPLGEIKVEWEYTDERFSITFVLPEGVRATLLLPDGTTEENLSGPNSISSGCHRPRSTSSLRPEHFSNALAL